MFPIGAAIGAIGSIAGGLLGNDAAKQQMEMQEKFAREGIRWRVKDAKKAGIHPLYALGAQTSTYSPVMTGDFGVSQAGQDIGRAIDSTRTEGERGGAINQALLALQMENQKLQNDSLRMDVASKVARLAENPAMPGTKMNIEGQGNSGVSLPVPATGGARVGVTNPGLGQKAEDHYSDVGGMYYGAMALIEDHRRELQKWFNDKFGAGLNRYTPDVLGAEAGRAFRGPRTPHTGEGESWY